MPWREPEYDGEYPSLGWKIIEAWYEYLPSPRDEAEPFQLTDEQALEIVEWYSIHPVSGEFIYRRGQSRKAKGTGKSPLEAAKCITELALPCKFGGWDAYGEPVAIPWGYGNLPLPWVQIAALSEDQDDNTWTPLYTFLTANDGKAADELGVDAGLTRCFLRGKPGAKIEPVTSRAGSREGQPVTYGNLDETGMMTVSNGGVKLAATIRRNTSKMGGRCYETTNGYMPGEGSVAERTDKAIKAGREGIFNASVEAPEMVDGIEVNEDAPDHILRKALEVPYAGCWWVDLDRLVQDIRDPDTSWADSERFFFNWNRKGEGKAVDPKRWAELEQPGEPEPGAWIGVGFDGSISNDATVLIGCSREGWSFTIAAWERPRLDDGRFDKTWKVPRLEVHEKVAEVFDRYKVGIMLCDEAKWWTEIEGWALDYGEDVVMGIDTQSIRFPRALDRWLTAIREGAHTHDGSDVLRRHVEAAQLEKRREKAEDEDGRTLYNLVKGADGRKIDAAVADVLAFEAAMTMPEVSTVAPFAVWV